MELIFTLFIGTGVAVAAVAGWWAVRTARRTLGRSLGRSVRDGEELSLKVWMEVPPKEIDAAVKELNKNPFNWTDDTDQ